MNRSSFALIAVIAVVFTGTISVSNNRDNALRYIDQCVNTKATEQGAHVAPQIKWDMFSEQCAEEYKAQ